MNPRQILFALAAVFVVIGVVLGTRTISTDGLACGSVFVPSDSAAKQADFGEELGGTLAGATADSDTSNNQDACGSAVSDAKPMAYGAVGLGVIALIAGLMVSPRRPVAQS